MMYGYGFGSCLGRFGGANGFSGPGFGGGGFIMMFFMLILIGFVIYMVVKQNRRNFHQASTAYSTNDALEVLKMRYAKGEISDQEFAAKKAELFR